MEIGPQGAAIAGVLAEHEDSVNLDQSADVPVNGAAYGVSHPKIEPERTGLRVWSSEVKCAGTVARMGFKARRSV